MFVSIFSGWISRRSLADFTKHDGFDMGKHPKRTSFQLDDLVVGFSLPEYLGFELPGFGWVQTLSLDYSLGISHRIKWRGWDKQHLCYHMNGGMNIHVSHQLLWCTPESPGIHSQNWSLSIHPAWGGRAAQPPTSFGLWDCNLGLCAFLVTGVLALHQRTRRAHTEIYLLNLLYLSYLILSNLYLIFI